MKDKLLEHYNQELAAIHKTAGEFAKAHPRVANHLHLGQKRSDDPLINHLVESFAFMSARVHNQLETDNQRACENILSVLYPHYLRPFPACAVVQMQPKATTSAGYTITKNTQLAVDHKDTSLRFSTGYEIQINPINITDVKLTPWTAAKKFNQPPAGLESCLSVTISALPKADSDAINISQLSLYLNGQGEYRDTLLYLLLEHCQSVAVENEQGELEALTNWRLQQRGLTAHDALLPGASQSNCSHHLFTEYLQFADKFFFIDLHVDELRPNEQGNITLHFYFDQHDIALANEISAEDIKTNCTPIINLYPTEAEPIQVTQWGHDYVVNADAYQPHHHHDVYQINQVTLHSPQQHGEQVPPFYAAHQHVNNQPGIYWSAQLQPHWQNDSQSANGYDTCIRFINNQPGQTLHQFPSAQIAITATNRHLPQEIIPSVDRLYFWNSDHDNVCQPEPITAMSHSRFPCQEQQAHWLLVSLISQQHQLLGQQNNAKQWVQSYLGLLGHSDHADIALLSSCIQAITSEAVVRRHPTSPRLGYCQGLSVTIEIDENVLSAAAFYPFATMLRHFFIEHTQMNSFIALSLTSTQHGRIAHWPAEIGLEDSL